MPAPEYQGDKGQVGAPDYVDDVPVAGQEPSTPFNYSDPATPAPDFSYTYPEQAPGTSLMSCGITVAYVIDQGLRGAPVAAPFGAQASVWRVHGGMAWKVVSGVFQSMGGPPTLPEPVTNANEVLFNVSVTIPANQVMGDGQTIYVRTVQFFFLLQQPPALTDALYGAVVQLDTTALSANAINPGDYIQNLIGPIPTPAQFTGGAINF